jgi:Mg-chelatase subunit ChlD
MDTAAPQNDLTEIAVILDRSGSMQSIKEDMEGGLWALVTEQHGQPGRCRVSLYQFDDVWEVAFEGKPSGEIKAEDCRLVPRGSTALNDAVVKSLAALEARVLAESETERPSRLVVVVITDGQENASRENTPKDAHEAIGRATDKFGWRFVFLAANQAGFAEGQSMMRGHAGAAAVMYDTANVDGMYLGTSRAISDYRMGHSESVDVQSNLSKPDDPEDSSGGGPKVH